MTITNLHNIDLRKFSLARLSILNNAPRLKPEIKSRWVADLRSGNFKQGKRYLKVIDRHGQAEHCCLGVLCEGLSLKQTDLEMTHTHSFMVVFQPNGFPPESSAILSVEILNMIAGPSLGYPGDINLDRALNSILTDFNDATDEARLSFSQIADVVEFFL